MDTKPLLRGHFHQAAFFAALGAGLMLVAGAQGFERKTVAIIYFISLVGLYGISALYHRPMWQANVRRWMKRLDHSAIFILIGGTATPIFVLGVGGDTGVKLLWLIWVGAAVGIMRAVFWVTAPRWLTAFIYVLVGFSSIPYIPELYRSLGVSNFTLMLGGGAIYAVGAVVYALKKPGLFPRVFGYHELFHVLVIIASISHFVVVYRLVQQS